jgi:hypothetical protein
MSGFFSQLFGGQSKDYGAATEIANIISGGDSAVINMVSACVADHKAYFRAHRSDFEHWGEERCPDKETAVQIAMVDSLVTHRYAAIVDWRGELEEILSEFKDVTDKMAFPVDLGNIPISGELSETDEVLSALNNSLVQRGFVLGYINLGGDSYNLFLTTPDKMKRLASLANDIGCRITTDYR